MTNYLRRRVSSGSPYEPRIGISRAIRSGTIVAVSGTAPIGPDGKTVAPGNPELQTRRCLEIIREALEKAGATLSDVTRTRVMLTRIEDWESVAKFMASILVRFDQRVQSCRSHNLLTPSGSWKLRRMRWSRNKTFVVRHKNRQASHPIEPPRFMTWLYTCN